MSAWLPGLPPKRGRGAGGGDAAPIETYPRLKVLYAGPYREVLGEEAYFQHLMPVIAKLGPDHWEFLGLLSQDQMPAFFAACNLLVVPSLNSTESFGLVQVEAMLCGTPAIASDLPGVRQPPRMTGMGRSSLRATPARWPSRFGDCSRSQIATGDRAVSSQMPSAWSGRWPATRRYLPQ